MIYSSEKELIEACKKKKRSAQKQLYEQYSGLLYVICMRYGANSSDAEDVMHEGFIKIFSVIKQYEYRGSFEGWLKRVMVNHAISSLKKNKKFNDSYSIEDFEIPEDETSELDNPTNIIEKAIAAKWDQRKILDIINKLPHPYNIVFNLFAIEQYSHKEIASQLNIKENTSKSLLRRARIKLQQEIEILLKAES